MENILVVGGGGFLGRAIIDQLLSANSDPDSYPIKPSSRYNIRVFDIRQTFEDDRIEFVQGDITDPECVEKATRGIDTVIHTASPPHGRGAVVYFKVNVDGTRNVIDTCIKNKVRRLVYTSSASVIYNGQDLRNADETTPYCEKHMDAYNETKALAEELVLKANSMSPTLQTVAVRPSGIFGPRDMQGASTIMDACWNGKYKVQLGFNKTLFDWTYVDNIAYAHVLAMERMKETSDCGGQAFIITNDQPVFFWDFVKLLWFHMGYSRTLLYVMPLPLAFFLAYLTELFAWIISPLKEIHPTFTRFRIMVFGNNRYFDISKAKSILKYKPMVDLEEGIKRTVRYFERELTAFRSAFAGKETEANWEGRLQALQRLRSLLKTPDAHSESFTGPYMKTVLPFVIECTASLRSGLVMPACTVIEELSETIHGKLEPYSDAIAKALIKLTTQTKKMVIAAGKRAMDAMIVHSHSGPKLITLFAGMSEDKSSTGRVQAAGFILVAMQNGNCDGTLGVVEKFLAKGLVDSHPDVREISRQIYFTMQKSAPSTAASFYQSLDPKVQKTISSDKMKKTDGKSVKSFKSLLPVVKDMIAPAHVDFSRSSDESASNKIEPALSLENSAETFNSHSLVQTKTDSVGERDIKETRIEEDRDEMACREATPVPPEAQRRHQAETQPEPEMEIPKAVDISMIDSTSSVMFEETEPSLLMDVSCISITGDVLDASQVLSDAPDEQTMQDISSSQDDLDFEPLTQVPMLSEVVSGVMELRAKGSVDNQSALLIKIENQLNDYYQLSKEEIQAMAEFLFWSLNSQSTHVSSRTCSLLDKFTSKYGLEELVKCFLNLFNGKYSKEEESDEEAHPVATALRYFCKTAGSKKDLQSLMILDRYCVEILRQSSSPDCRLAAVLFLSRFHQGEYPGTDLEQSQLKLLKFYFERQVEG
ncbi:hypothetical protein HDU97_005100 [Phlyctochytrium planicorne]|nr:hypothetical protein HDU97_005100 [Phlyctochytrium planicorne]